jgi:adenylyltransferase/sulfurtransferase
VNALTIIERYSRQVLFPPIGAEGQKKLSKSSAVIIGCGALGTVLASILVRAGVGNIKIVDRDFIELHNLQRQVLFDEDDIINQLPKAIAAEQHLRKVNSEITIQGIVADVNYTNIEKLVNGTDLILDGLDNRETRFLINDISLKLKIPWIYGGAVSSYGMTMNIIPGETPCIRCLWHKTEGSGLAATCDTAGVIAPAPFITASLQATEALKILTGARELNRDLVSFDVWASELKHFKINRDPDCPACRGKYEFLDAQSGTTTTTLCGQNAVQVLNSNIKKVSFKQLETKLKPLGKVSYNEFLFNFIVDSQEMVIFPDGRAIVKNTNDESFARGLYAKYIGA